MANLLHGADGVRRRSFFLSRKRLNIRDSLTHKSNMRNMKVMLVQLVCLRCGHKWSPRHADVRICPKCKSLYWDTPPSSKNRKVVSG